MKALNKFVNPLVLLKARAAPMAQMGNGLRWTSTPQLPFEEPQIPSNRDHKALNRGTLGGLGRGTSFQFHFNN